MVFLMKIKTEQRGAETPMPSKMSNDYDQLRATDLSAILFKDASKTPSQLERDAGFCSGGSEIGDDYQSERIQSSPSSTDASEDSIDIKLGSIVIPPKRKAFVTAVKSENDIPLKKRFKYDSVFAFSNETDAQSTDKLIQSDTFRPWISEQLNNNKQCLPNEAEILARHPGVTTLHRVPADIDGSKLCQDEQPLALVTKKQPTTDNKCNDDICNQTQTPIKPSKSESKPKPVIDDDLKPSSRSSAQRNYKNMTRERRIEANARERTRVHTISAAFDTLRQAIPSYSNTQKLSKLSILRVACSYILTLSRMTGSDYSADQSAPSIQSCLEEITKTIQTEGKARKRKDE